MNDTILLPSETESLMEMSEPFTDEDNDMMRMSLVDYRSKQIKNLEVDLQLLQSLHEDLEKMVQEQSENVDKLETNTRSTEFRVEKAVETLSSIVPYKNKLLPIVGLGTIITGIWLPIVPLAMTSKASVSALLTGMILMIR